MSNILTSSNLQSRHFPVILALVSLLALIGVAFASLQAQVDGDRGIPPIASTTDFEVFGIEVNVRGASAEEAQANGWRRARRVAWDRLGGPDLPDSRLEDMISSMVVESESIGPRRYIATLGVVFDRQRAGGLLGASATQSRSAPMLTMPVLISGGTNTMFEVRNPWQRAWAEFQSGNSPVDYVRPVGAGGDSLLLTYGQTSRRSRAWWNVVLGQFGAADVLVPIARLERQWPGGPVEGHFSARYGPDNRFLDSFSMKAEDSEGLNEMLDAAVIRLDEIYAAALANGTLSTDPTLTLDMVELTPEIRALLEEGQMAEAYELALEEGMLPEVTIGAPVIDQQPQAEQAIAISTITVQVATPDARAFDGALTGVRSIAGVQGVAVTSTAIGGTSVLRISYAGSLSELAGGLRGAGWNVVTGENALAISR